MADGGRLCFIVSWTGDTSTMWLIGSKNSNIVHVKVHIIAMELQAALYKHTYPLFLSLPTLGKLCFGKNLDGILLSAVNACTDEHFCKSTLCCTQTLKTDG